MREKTEIVPSHRAPLFLFVVPFGGGLVGAWFLPLAPTPFAVGLAVLLLALLAFSGAGGARWHSAFFFAAVGLGGMHGELLLPRRAPCPEPGSVPREQTVSVDPLQVFGGPPLGRSHSAIAAVPGEDRTLFLRAPAGRNPAPLLEGFRWELRGVERPLASMVDEPGFRTYLKDRGVSAGFEAVLPPRPAGVERPTASVFAFLLEEAKAALAAGSSPGDPTTRVYQALVLGQRRGLEPDQKADFRDTGTAHLFAISGLHVGLVGVFLLGLFRTLGLGDGARVVLTLLVLLFYVLLTGAAPSAVRAYLMLAFFVAAKVVDRGYRPESALAASALAVLLFAPEQLFSLGFQLSYTVVLSILVFGAPLGNELVRLTNPPYWLPGRFGSRFFGARKWFFGGLAISFAAFLASSPLIIDRFHVLPFSSILLNLVLIPPATVVLVAGFLSLVAGLLGIPGVSAAFNAIARPVLEAMTATVGEFAGISFASLQVAFPREWIGPALVLAFLGTAFWTGGRRRFRLRHLGLPLAVLLVSILVAEDPVQAR